MPDVLASTTNLLKVAGWQTGQPFGEGTPNFQVMREWNRSEVYRRVMHYFAERLGRGEFLLIPPPRAGEGCGAYLYPPHPEEPRAARRLEGRGGLHASRRKLGVLLSMRPRPARP